jgi:Flp pilus assembly pilin Flp
MRGAEARQWPKERGQALTEYAVKVALIVLVVVGVLTLVGWLILNLWKITLEFPSL